MHPALPVATALAALLAVASLSGAQVTTSLPTAPVSPPGGNAWLLTAEQHERWTEHDGAPDVRTLAISESRDGFLWLGTERGLYRFDGNRFVRGPAALDRAIGEATVPSIAETADGALWFAIIGTGVVRWRAGTATLFDTTGGLPDADVRALHVDGRGVLWYAGATGVARLDGSRFVRMRGEREPVQALSSAPDGTLWTASQHLSRLLGDSLMPVAIAGLLPGEEAKSIHWARDGTLWLGTVNALLRVEAAPRPPRSIMPESWRVVRRYDARSGVSSPYVRSIAEDSAGVIWAVSEGGGVVAVSARGVARFDTHDGLSDDGAAAVTATPSGSVWVGTTHGIDRFRPRAIQTVTNLQGLEPRFVWSVTADGDGVWLGTSGGGLYWTDGTRLRHASIALPSDIVYSVATTADGALWLRTGAGLSRYVDGKPTPVPVLTDAERAVSRAAFVDRDGALWLGGDFGVVHVQGDSVRRLRTGMEAPVKRSDAFVQTADGTIWMKGNDLVAWRDGQLTRYGAAQGMRALTAIAADGNDVWATDYSGGLRLVHGGRVYSFAESLLRHRTYGLVLDGADGLWLASDDGLQRVSRAALRARVAGGRAPIDVLTFDRGDGLWTLEFNSSGDQTATRARDGRLWFASAQGAVWVDPTRLPAPPALPVPVIDAVLLDGRDYGLATAGAATPSMPRGQGGLEIHYAAPALIDAAGLRFRYRLAGYDTGWVNAGPRHTAFFTGVPGGDYRFEVQSSRGDGRWSRAATTPIVLEPRFVDTPTFRIAAALLGVIGLFGAGTLVSRERTRRLRARAVELQTLVDERTHALQTLNGELEQRVAERTAERLRLQEDLQQAQKLDSIGRLAGGIAHDLNNMLSAILSFAEFAEDPSSEEQRSADLHEVRAAAQRASGLTQQLLAFSRRQLIDPRVLDLRGIVNGMASLLRRLLGADIDVRIESADDLWLVRMDPSQVEQVLVNLAVNARDAMPDGGALRIALANASLDDAAATRRSLTAGEYVRLTVSDSGTGMPDEVRQRIFEPFFTTKDVGKGTGLGLSICYGIVAQAGGAIDVTSEVGQGTRFDVWLPRTAEQDAAPSPDDLAPSPSGDETILLVDDEEPVRAAARRVLTSRGYTVLEATDGQHALELAASLQEPPALLLSDVVMPRLGGVELARRLRDRWPAMRVLLMSGYVERAMFGDAAPPAAFLRKPITPTSLAWRVREVLDAPVQTDENTARRRA